MSANGMSALQEEFAQFYAEKTARDAEQATQQPVSDEQRKTIGEMTARAAQSQSLATTSIDGYKSLGLGDPTVNRVVQMRAEDREHDLQKELRLYNDGLMLWRSVLECQMKMNKTFDDEALAKNMRSGKLYEGYTRLCQFAQHDLGIKALVSDGSAPLFPTGYSADIIDAVFVPTSLPGILQNVQIPRSPFMWPVANLLTHHARPAGANLSNAGVMVSPTNEVFANTTFNAGYLQNLVVVDWEAEQDAIIELIKQMARSIQFALEDIILNGDSAKSLDSDADYTGAIMMRDGLRKYAKTNGLEADDLAANSATTWTPSCFQSMMTRFNQAYVVPRDDVVMVVPANYDWHFLCDPSWVNFQTAYAAGSLAGITQGTITSFFGVKKAITSYLSDKMANGRNTGKGTTSAIVAFNRNAWVIAHQGAPTTEVIRDPEGVQYRIVTNFRVDPIRAWRPGDASVSVSYNVK